jgi:hypothetical protein
LQKKISEKFLLKVLLIAETGLSLSHSFHEIIGNGLAKEPGQTLGVKVVNALDSVRSQNKAAENEGSCWFDSKRLHKFYQSSRKMTHEVKHQYDEILHGALPGLEIHIVYDCESQITYDEDGGEEANILTAIACTVNGTPADIIFPEAKHGVESRNFLARLRESARQALYAQELREKAATAKFSIGEQVVYRVLGKPDRRGVTTSTPNRDNRVGVKFEDEDWAYCHTDFLFAHPFAFQTGK